MQKLFVLLIVFTLSTSAISQDAPVKTLYFQFAYESAKVEYTFTNFNIVKNDQPYPVQFNHYPGEMPLIGRVKPSQELESIDDFIFYTPSKGFFLTPDSRLEFSVQLLTSAIRHTDRYTRQPTPLVGSGSRISLVLAFRETLEPIAVLYTLGVDGHYLLQSGALNHERIYGTAPTDPTPSVDLNPYYTDREVFLDVVVQNGGNAPSRGVIMDTK